MMTFLVSSRRTSTTWEIKRVLRRRTMFSAPTRNRKIHVSSKKFQRRNWVDDTLQVLGDRVSKRRL
jgi:hypothetical protein